MKDTEYLVIESTYGDRLHSEERVDYVKELAARIQRVLDRGGNMIIPSFAVGRTQEILYFIREIKEKNLVTGHGDFPVYVDSPLAIEATGIFLQCDTQFVDEEMQALIRSGVNPIVFPGLELAVSQEESRAINEDKTPKIIISASGMCDAGRVRHHLKHNLWRPESMVLFVGYQAAGTLGRALVDGVKHVKLFNEDIQVEAEIESLPGISGHADKNGLLRWLGGFEQKPRLVFVNHGDPGAAESFTACLQNELGYQAYAVGGLFSPSKRRARGGSAPSAPPSPASSPRPSACSGWPKAWRATPTRSWPPTPIWSRAWRIRWKNKGIAGKTQKED